MNEKQIPRNVKSMLVMISALFVASLLSVGAATPPKKGDVAPNFNLKTLDDKPIELNKLTATGKVVLVVLRGWSGYQCPMCERQVGDLIRGAAQLKQRGVRMLFVYPGPTDQLKAHAQEFLHNKAWPSDFLFVTDPDYTFTSAYGLRWDAPNETAYPSTFIVGVDAKVLYAHVSKEHGGRIGSDELLKQL